MCVKWTNQLDAMEYGILRAPRGRLFCIVDLSTASLSSGLESGISTWWAGDGGRTRSSMVPAKFSTCWAADFTTCATSEMYSRAESRRSDKMKRNAEDVRRRELMVRNERMSAFVSSASSSSEGIAVAVQRYEKKSKTEQNIYE